MVADDLLGLGIEIQDAAQAIRGVGEVDEGAGDPTPSSAPATRNWRRLMADPVRIPLPLSSLRHFGAVVRSLTHWMS